MTMSSTTTTSEQATLIRSAGEPALSVRRLAGAGRSLLYVHGATFPAALSINYRIDGQSWADDLNARGFDVWSFDFAGYGGSERPPAMAGFGSGAVPGRANEAEGQIERVVSHMLTAIGRTRISIISHSWGTIPAGRFAGRHPELVERLILFGPIAERRQGRKAGTTPALLVTAADQWRSFQSGVPEGEPPVISEQCFGQWASAYLASDPAASTRTPPSVAVPAGPDADLADAWSGNLPYDPSEIQAPTLILRGEWDPVTPDADAASLLKAMTGVPGGARDVKLPRGAHRMHLETNRQALFDAAAAFLAEDE